MTLSDCSASMAARILRPGSWASFLAAALIATSAVGTATAQNSIPRTLSADANAPLLEANPEGSAAPFPGVSSSRTGLPSPTQTTPPASVPTSSPAYDKTICAINRIGRCIKDLGEDDKAIFTSPFHLRGQDGLWLVSLAGATGLAFSYDQQAEQQLGPKPSFADKASSLSNIGSLYASGGEGAAIYFAGLLQHNPKLAETGRLGAEAVIDSGTVVLLTKFVSDRQRPSEGSGKGSFWPNGKSGWTWDTSFPSDHAAASMALARVVAGEYPRWYVAGPAYGFAETVSVLRILGKEHFPSDVVVGQAIGFLTGTYLLNHRALYAPGKKNVASRLMQSAFPIADAQTRTFGVAMNMRLGR